MRDYVRGDVVVAFEGGWLAGRGVQEEGADVAAGIYTCVSLCCDEDVRPSGNIILFAVVCRNAPSIKVM